MPNEVSYMGTTGRTKETDQRVDAMLTEKVDVRALRRAGVSSSRQVLLTAEDVRAIRESSGVSQAALAILLGTSTAAVTQWELGRRTPSGATATLLDLIRRKGLDVLF